MGEKIVVLRIQNAAVTLFYAHTTRREHVVHIIDGQVQYITATTTTVDTTPVAGNDWKEESETTPL